jgi:hypothetical protein
LEDKTLFAEIVLALLEVSDPSFKSKNRLQVTSLAMILTIFEQTNYNITEIKKAVSASKMNLSEFMLSRRQRYALKKTFSSVRKSYSLRLRVFEKQHLPPKRYIGVGYKDKGSRKNIAFDGSPSWQEVASNVRFGEDPQNRARRMLRLSHVSIYDESKSWIRLIHSKLLTSYR